MKYKNIKEEIEKQFEFRIYKRGLLISTKEGKKDGSLWKFIVKALDSNTKRVKKESVEKLEEMKGAVIKGTGKKWLVEDYISRKQAIKEIK